MARIRIHFPLTNNIYLHIQSFQPPANISSRTEPSHHDHCAIPDPIVHHRTKRTARSYGLGFLFNSLHTCNQFSISPSLTLLSVRAFDVTTFGQNRFLVVASAFNSRITPGHLPFSLKASTLLPRHFFGLMTFSHNCNPTITHRKNKAACLKPRYTLHLANTSAKFLAPPLALHLNGAPRNQTLKFKARQMAIIVATSRS